MRATAVGALLALLLLAGCGRFGRAEPEQGLATAGGGEVVPSPTSVVATTTTTTADVAGQAPTPTPTSTPGGAVEDPPTSVAAAAPPGPGEPRVANAATATTDGLEVTVVAEDGPDYGPGARFRIEIRLTNVGDVVRFHRDVDLDRAVLLDDADGIVWGSQRCDPTRDVYRIQGGAFALQPGDSTRVVVRYPQVEGPDQGCALPSGRYRLVGSFPVCDAGSERETANPGTFTCADDDTAVVSSLPLVVSFG